MSDENDEIINDNTTNNDGANEEDEVHKLLNYKTATYMGIAFAVLLIAGLIISFMNFQAAADRREHVKYFWVERNIPKGYPDTIYQKKIIFMDSAEIRTRDSFNQATAVHDTLLNR